MTRLVDDLDGSEAATTLSFSLDGLSYEIDLSESHLIAFHEALAPFVTAARKVPVSRHTRATPAPRTPAPQRNGNPAPKQNTISKEAVTARPAAVNSPAFTHPDLKPADGRAAPAPSKPRRAPLVADPFNPGAHR